MPSTVVACKSTDSMRMICTARTVPRQGKRSRSVWMMMFRLPRRSARPM